MDVMTREELLALPEGTVLKVCYKFVYRQEQEDLGYIVSDQRNVYLKHRQPQYDGCGQMFFKDTTYSWLLCGEAILDGDSLHHLEKLTTTLKSNLGEL